MGWPTGPAWFLLLASMALTACIVTVGDDAESAQYDVDLLYKEADNVKTAHGTDPVTFNFSLEHTGDALSEEVTVRVLNVSEYWHVVLAATTSVETYTGVGSVGVHLARGGRANLAVTVTPPVNALPGAYWMKVDAYPKKAPATNRSRWICVVVPAIVDLQLVVWNAPPDFEYRATPPSVVAIRLALYNLGNGPDSFLVKGDSSLAGEGWKLEWEGGLDAFGYTPELPPDRSKQSPHFIDVNVTVPAGVRAGTSSRFVANASSTVDPSLSRPPVRASVVALQYYDFQVYVEGGSKKVGHPGDNVTFALRVVNLGNGWDTLNVTPDWDPELNPGFVARVEPGSVDIDMEGEALVDYVVQVPMGPPCKDYLFHVEVRSSSGGLPPEERTFLVSVPRSHGVVVEAPDNQTTTSLGGSVEFEAVVRNAGNGLDTFEVGPLEGVPENWLTYIQPPEVSLLQDEVATAKVIVIVPSRVEDVPLRSYDLELPVRSARGDASGACFLRVGILAFHRIEWMHEGEPVTSPERTVSQEGAIRPRPTLGPDLAEGLSVTLHLRNYGNADDTVSLEANSSTPHLEASLLATSMELGPGRTGEARLSLHASGGPELGVHTVYVLAESSDPEVALRVLVLEVEVVSYIIQVPGHPTLLDGERGDLVLARTSVPPGGRLRLSLPITNVGEGPAEDLLLRVVDRFDAGRGVEEREVMNTTLPHIPSGETHVAGRAPWTEDNPAMEWTARPAGAQVEHALSLQVCSPGGVLVLGRSQVTVAVEEPPVVTVMSPGPGERVRGRFFVDVTVTDDDDRVEWVRVRMDDGEWRNASLDGVWSLPLDASDYDEGEHVLYVRAHDGVIGSQVESVEFTIVRGEGLPGSGTPAAVLCLLLAAVPFGLATRRSRPV